MNLFIGCSATGTDEEIINRSKLLISSIATLENVDLVFGAYNKSIMGICYEEFKKNGKKIIGVTTKKYEKDINAMDLDEVIIADTTMDRSKQIYEKSDVLLFLPGGIGTYSEILAAIEEHKTKKDNKLLILYNDNFFYTPFIKEMYKLYESKFIEKSIGEYIRIESINDEIIKLIEKEI